MAFDVSKKDLYERNFWLFFYEVFTQQDRQVNVTEIHKEWCDDFQEDFGERRRYMLLKPRGTYKTTVYIQAYACWLFIRNPDRTVLLVSATGAKADENYEAIKHNLTNNERILACWGRLYDNGRGRFTKKGIWHRHRDPEDPNFSTPNIRSVGKGSTITGQHYDSIFCDDIVNEDDRESPTEREKTKRYFKRLQPILNNDAPGEIIIIGTRWHFDDLYHFIQFELNPGLSEEERYTCEIEAVYEMDVDLYNQTGEIKYLVGADGQFILRFPKKYGHKEIAELMETMGPAEFYAQYLNNPTPSETTGFPRDNAVFFEANEMGELLKHLEIITYWDPATSEQDTLKVCYSSIVTIAVNRKTKEVFVLGATLEKMNTVIGVKRVKDHILAYHAEGLKSRLAFEASGDPVLLERELKTMLFNVGAMKTRLKKVPHTHGGTSKDARIEMMTDVYDLGLLKFRSDWRRCAKWKTYHLLMEQLFNWPLHTFKDGPDALAGAIEEADFPRMHRRVSARGVGGKFRKRDEDSDEDRKNDNERDRRAKRQRKQRARGLDPRLRRAMSPRQRR